MRIALLLAACVLVAPGRASASSIDLFFFNSDVTFGLSEVDRPDGIWSSGTGTCGNHPDREQPTHIAGAYSRTDRGSIC